MNVPIYAMKILLNSHKTGSEGARNDECPYYRIIPIRGIFLALDAFFAELMGVEGCLRSKREGFCTPPRGTSRNANRHNGLEALR